MKKLIFSLVTVTLGGAAHIAVAQVFEETATAEIFGDCPALVAQLSIGYTWADFPMYVYEHSICAP